jgi:hypothetical protein
MPCFDFGILSPVARSENTPKASIVLLMETMFFSEPYGVMNDFNEGFTSKGLKFRMPNSEGAAYLEDDIGKLFTNIHMMYGTEDPQIHRDDVVDSYKKIVVNSKAVGGNDNAQLSSFGYSSGTVLPYSHFDLVLGRDAPKDVFPMLVAYLKRNEINKVVLCETGAKQDLRKSSPAMMTII